MKWQERLVAASGPAAIPCHRGCNPLPRAQAWPFVNGLWKDPPQKDIFMADFSAIDKYIDTHLEDSIAELARLCTQPSVSAQGLGITECAELVASLLRRRGFTVEVIATHGNPVVYAEAER